MAEDWIRDNWRVIIAGGGPAAALQIQRLRVAGVAPAEVLLVSESWGAPGMAFLGAARLQSYVHELDLGTGPALTTSGFVQPTGTEFHRHAQRVLHRSGAVLMPGIVTDLCRDPAGFAVRVRIPVGEREFRAPCVVLATGTRPKRPPAHLVHAAARTYDQAYLDVQTGRTGDYADRPVYVIGSGNSAMQTASLLASVSGSVMVLAARYVGMYPSETLDRFAWRAPSQLTWELVVKSSYRERACDGTGICVRFLVYRSVEIVGGRLRVTVNAADNTHQMGRHSRPLLHSHVTAVPVEGGWREESPVASSTVVWATGCDPVYPDSELVAGLTKDANGYLLADERGQTACPGLFVTGACAGRRAVNEMVPAQTVEAR
ncbi:MAG: FAD-dependent oxidoreductase [Pseudonocardiaceae bacterium]